MRTNVKQIINYTILNHRYSRYMIIESKMNFTSVKYNYKLAFKIE